MNKNDIDIRRKAEEDVKILPEETVEVTSEKYTVVPERLNIRKTPDTTTDANIVRVAERGETCEVEKIDGEWAVLTDGNYVKADFLAKE